MTSLERLSAAHALAPATWVMPSLPSLWGLTLGTRDVADGAPRALRDHDRLWEAFARDELSLGDPVRIAGRVAPAGRHLAASLLPALVRDEALRVAWSHAWIARWLHLVGATLHVEVASRCAAALERLGDAWLSRSGASWCIDDLRGPPDREEILARARDRVAQSQRDYDGGEVTDGERYNQCVDAWARAFARLGDAVLTHHRGTLLDALRVSLPAADAYAWLKTLCAAVGIVTKPSREVLERPVWRSFGEGLDAHGFFLRATEQRARETHERERLREVDALFGELCDALGGWRVTSLDCGDDAGERLCARDTPHGEGPTLFERAEGHAVARDVVNARGDVVAREGEHIGARHGAAWIGVSEVTVRTALTCRDAEGVCAHCHGLDPVDETAMHLGDPVGLRAAWCIARTVAGLPARWRTPYAMGVSNGRMSRQSAPFRAVVHFDGDDLVAGRHAARVGAITLIADDGARVVLPVDEGDELRVAHGAVVEPGASVLDFSPWLARVHVAKVAAGVRARVELAPGSTHDALEQRQSEWVHAPAWYVRRDATATLALRSLDDGRVACEIPLSGDEGPIPLGAVVERGDVVVATRRSHLEASFDPEELSTIRHRLGLSATGYDRLPAMQSPCDGVVVEASRRRIVVQRADGTTYRVVRRREFLAVCRVGDVVRVGDVLVPGRESLPRHLRLFGALSTARRIIDALASHAAVGGEPLARVHGEMLARAMLAWRRVRRPGDTGLRRNAVLAWAECERIQRETVARGERPAEVVTVLRGVGRMAGRTWKLTHRAQVERRRRRAR